MHDIHSVYVGKRVLITGGLGFIGSTLAIRLAKLGAQVTIIDSELPDSGSNRFNIEPVAHSIESIIGDIGNADLIGELVRHKDLIFNLAGTLSHTDSMRHPHRDLYANCSAHVTLLEACRSRNTTTKILYTGTRGQYGNPQTMPVNETHPLASSDVNGINKTAGEAYHLLYAKHYGMHCCSLRLSNTFGPRHQMKHHRQGVLNWFVRRVLDGEPIFLFGDGSQVRDIHYVDDVVEAMILTLASNNTSGNVYNLGGTPISLKEVAELLTELHGSGSIEYRPYPSDFKWVEVGDFISDYSKIQQAIGWKPTTPPREGFLKTLSYYQQHRSKYW
jgi:UDP-glucose 4-epimerase